MAASGTALAPPAAGRIDLVAARRLGVDPGDPWLGADPSNPEYRETPAPFLRRLREVAPVSLTPLGSWRLARYEDCTRLLREVRSGVRFEDGTPALGARSNVRRGPGQFMLQQDPPTTRGSASS